MLGGLSPSHFLLIFLSGAMGMIFLVPPVIYVLMPVTINNIADIYQFAFKLGSQAGFLGSILGVALVYFVGITLDGLNVIARRKRKISRLKKFVGILWGYRKIIKHMETDRGIKSQLTTESPSERDVEYARQIMFYAEHPAFGAVRGWEFFLSFSFTLFTLTLSLLFIVLSIVSVLALVKHNVSILSSAPWLIATAVAYVILVPGDIAHTYARVNAEEAIKREFERSQRKE